MYKIIINETFEKEGDIADGLRKIADMIERGILNSDNLNFSVVDEQDSDFEFLETSDSLESKIKVLIESNPGRFPYNPSEIFFVLGDEEVDSIDIDGVSTTECDYDFCDMYKEDLKFIYNRLVKHCQE